MIRSLYLATAIGFAAFVMNVHAADEKDGMGNTSGMKTDCMKDMKMDCMGNDAGKDPSKAASLNGGEVRAVDKAKKSATLKHGPIKNRMLEMGPMTMSFPVRDPAMLSKVKVGDTARFVAENISDVATVSSLTVQH
jgi:Cu(I)/Ag(I) efflux system protein CusF